MVPKPKTTCRAFDLTRPHRRSVRTRYAGCMSALAHDVSQTLQKYGFRLNTDLGQHFMIDPTVLEDILEVAVLKPGERVIEIGAGLGVLTRELVKTGANVTTIELDHRWVGPMKDFTGNPSNLTMIEGNALDIPFPDEPYKIVANIPYHITSPLFRHAFLESPRPPISATLLIQREVAERICDKKDGNMLQLGVKLFGVPKIVRHVPPGAFIPPPKVDSSVIHVECYSTPLVIGAHLDKVLGLAKIAFSQKRKMLSNTIGALPDGPAYLEFAGIAPTRRPQTLSIDEWIKLAAYGR